MAPRMGGHAGSLTARRVLLHDRSANLRGCSPFAGMSGKQPGKGARHVRTHQPQNKKVNYRYRNGQRVQIPCICLHGDFPVTEKP